MADMIAPVADGTPEECGPNGLTVWTLMPCDALPAQPMVGDPPDHAVPACCTGQAPPPLRLPETGSFDAMLVVVASVFVLAGQTLRKVATYGSSSS